MKSRPIPLFAAALAICLGAVRADAATLVYTNDVMGEIEPCGCRNNPTGGMPRMANFLERLGDQDQLVVDAGDLLFPTDKVPAALEKQSELQAAYLVRAMNLVGYDAAVPGEKDFALGVKAFERLAKKAEFPFLAANLKRDGKPLLPSHKIFKLKGLTVAVLGLAGEDLDWPDELKASPAIATARKLVDDLRDEADLVVALTHQGYEKDLELAEKVPGIDAIVGAHTQSFLQKPPRIGKTVVYQSSFRNQFIGSVPLAKKFSGAGHELVALDAGYDSPAGAPSKMDALVAEFKAAVAELNSKEDPTLTRASELPTVAKFHTFPKCAECHMKQFDFWRKTKHANALEPLVIQGQARNRECLGCHTVGLDDSEGFSSVIRLAERRSSSTDGKTTTIPTDELSRFLGEMHRAKSLETKVKLTRSDKNPLPLSRAVSQLERSWTPVQCENCHKPGGDHPFSGAYSKIVERETCLTCHTSERAPAWWNPAGATSPAGAASKDKKPDWKKIDGKLKLVACPAD